MRSIAILTVFILAGQAHAGIALVPHTVDGVFTGGFDDSGTAEWSGPNVVKSTFQVLGEPGGAALYVEQQSNTLYLMYDFLHSPQVFPDEDANDSFFDVFFQVGNEDYLVRIHGGIGSFDAYEKLSSEPTPLNDDGSFDVSAWELITEQDELNQFNAALAFGQSPESDADHLMAEFSVSIQSANNPGGLYSPEPAFWSASVSLEPLAAEFLDPPISSAIFTLNPDGTTTVDPLLDSSGNPAQRPQDVARTAVPEPASFLMFLFGASCLAACRARRGRHQA